MITFARINPWPMKAGHRTGASKPGKVVLCQCNMGAGVGSINRQTKDRPDVLHLKEGPTRFRKGPARILCPMRSCEDCSLCKDDAITENP